MSFRYREKKIRALKNKNGILTDIQLNRGNSDTSTQMDSSVYKYLEYVEGIGYFVVTEIRRGMRKTLVGIDNAPEFNSAGGKNLLSWKEGQILANPG